MTDHNDLKAIAEACKAQQPLRFMQHGADLFIRNDIGIVLHVVQNHRFPHFKAQNKNYADLVLAATPEVILGLIEGYVSSDCATQVAKELISVAAERDALKAEVEELRKDSARLDRLDLECEGYGCEVHEGNRWVLDGPFNSARDAIDALTAIPDVESDHDLAN